ncbi:hypothetical protein CONLIGDRAFT_641984 [Coniochaeta ligniaria NRRL 30616]|uniref:Uncharacterized protein n=1 Tax=Coniochaeta ligniaria NRRL 30616 TaxID=1408157 RepID=A0A1J7JWU9_9PEZI|nr:hypothetical protein CONLIGDRAFT_641984 [Coniochaeta ligniaria NRRL 30616]
MRVVWKTDHCVRVWWMNCRSEPMFTTNEEGPEQSAVGFRRSRQANSSVAADSSDHTIISSQQDSDPQDRRSASAEYFLPQDPAPAYQLRICDVRHMAGSHGLSALDAKYKPAREKIELIAHPGSPATPTTVGKVPALADLVFATYTIISIESQSCRRDEALNRPQPSLRPRAGS